MLLQSFEAVTPDLCIGFEPVLDLVQRCWVEKVQPLATDPANLDQTRGDQNVQMLGDRLTSYRQGLGQLLDGQRAERSQTSQNCPAGRISDGTEYAFHGDDDRQPKGCMSTVTIKSNWWRMWIMGCGV